MKFNYSFFIYFSSLIFSLLYGEEDFVSNIGQLEPYYGNEQVVLIASPGRSGSTMLTDVIKKYAEYTVLKTHLLPPDSQYIGKILFIFSDPDKAAESVLHRVLISPSNGATHFSHVETADQKWFNQIGRNGHNQTEKHNLLAYDAMGCAKQLREWLHKSVTPCHLDEAQILAIKFEDLWDPETVQMIKEFLKLKAFKLPSKRERGCDYEELSSKEIAFKSLYNKGTNEEPKYRAYDRARKLWREAPSFQFLKLAH